MQEPPTNNKCSHCSSHSTQRYAHITHPPASDAQCFNNHAGMPVALAQRIWMSLLKMVLCFHKCIVDNSSLCRCEANTVGSFELVDRTAHNDLISLRWKAFASGYAATPSFFLAMRSACLTPACRCHGDAEQTMPHRSFHFILLHYILIKICIPSCPCLGRSTTSIELKGTS